MNFFTRHGLKIRLDINFFLEKLTGKYTNEHEISEKLNTIKNITEDTFTYPNCFMYLTAICLMIFSNTSMYVFAICLAASYLLGCFLRIIIIPFVDTLAFHLTILFNFIFRNILIKVIIFITVSFLTKKFIYVILYIISAIVLGVIGLLINQIIVKYNCKKYKNL